MIGKYSLILGILLIIEAHSFYSEFPGPFCAKRTSDGLDGCCDSRKDDCAVPIAETLCYCDQFCDRSADGDCCPDYVSHCIDGPDPIPEESFNCNVYEIYQDENCNYCTKCISHPKSEIICEKDECIVEKDLIERINKMNLGWTARNSSEFWKRKLKDGFNLRLGTLEPNSQVRRMSRLSSAPILNVRNYNILQEYPGYVGPIKNQGWCNASWAFSTAGVSSDRVSFNSNGSLIADFSAQQLMSCLKGNLNCKSGHLDKAWNHLRKVGVVDEDFYPFNPLSKDHECKKKSEKPYHMGPAYLLKNSENDIKYEIFDRGSVQATMYVYRDFFLYGGGIYHCPKNDEYTTRGFHSVKLIGWGEENGTKFWMGANSWGECWGENGFFRIGINECGIQDYVLASLPLLKKNHKFSGQYLYKNCTKIAKK